MPPFRNCRWTAPIFPGGAQWIQLPCKLPPSLANLVLQSQTRLAHSDNRARNNNDRTQARGGPQVSSAVNEALRLLRHAPFPFAQVLDRKCDTSSHRSRPIQQTLPRSLDRFSSPSQKIAPPFLYRRETCRAG